MLDSEKSEAALLFNNLSSGLDKRIMYTPRR